MLSRKMTLKELDDLGAEGDLAKPGSKSDEDLYMQDKCDAADKIAAEIQEEHMKEQAAKGEFSRLMPYNQPVALVILACLGSCVNGAA